MSGQKEKRMIGDSGYEVLQSQWAGGKEYLLADNPNASKGERYLVCDYTSKGILGQYTGGMGSDSLIEMAQEYQGRIDKALEAVKAELDARGLPAELFTAGHCIPHDYGQDLKGKVVAIKPEELAPEYRRGSEQLIFVTGGFGAAPNARGRAVYCYQLSDKKEVRFNRHQVLGIVRELPDWAKDCLAAVKEQMRAEQSQARRRKDGAR